MVEAGRDDVPDFAAVYERYRERLRRGNEADFDEQVYGAIETLLADPDLRRRWQDRCRHVLVDEFQDLTGAYLLLIRLLASPQLDVFGVGDDDQTIYGYAGADQYRGTRGDEHYRTHGAARGDAGTVGHVGSDGPDACSADRDRSPATNGNGSTTTDRDRPTTTDGDRPAATDRSTRSYRDAGGVESGSRTV